MQRGRKGEEQEKEERRAWRRKERKDWKRRKTKGESE